MATQHTPNWLQRQFQKVVGVQKASTVTGSILNLTGPGEAIWNVGNYESYANEGYKQNPDAYACINLIAQAVEGMQFHIYESNDQDEKQKVNKGPFLDLLRRPNPHTSGSNFFGAWVRYFLIAGNNFVERVGPAPTRPPQELWLHRPDRVEILKGDAQQPIRGYRFKTWYRDDAKPWYPDFLKRNGISQPVHKVLHTKFFHPLDDWVGLPPMAAAARSIDQSNAAQEWNVALLQNGARPSGAMIFEEPIDDDQRDRVEDSFSRKFSGAANVGKTMVISGAKMTYQEFSQTAQEMSWLEGQERSTRKICAIFKVPVEMIGDSASRTYSNYYEARKSFYMEAVLPLVDFMLAEFNYWLAPFFGENMLIGYDRNDIEGLAEDRNAVSQRALAGLQAGAMTINQYLKATGEDPLPPDVGDVLLIPSSVIPTPISGPKPSLLRPVEQPRPNNVVEMPAQLEEPKPRLTRLPRSN